MPNATLFPGSHARESVGKPWRPALFPKQIELFNARERFILASGARLSTKTTAVLHRLVRHAWEIEYARIAIFSKTIKNARSAGVWTELVGPILRQWFAANLSSEYADFGYTIEPKVDGATRMHYFRLRNYWGGESEVQLHSLDYDGDVEAKLLGTSYSAIYFSELQEFHDPAIFNISTLQLRMTDVAYKDHLWIADTNPPDTGPNHFAYDLWFVQPHKKDHPDPELQKQFRLIEFHLDDNLSPNAAETIRVLKNNYRDDPEGWARFVEGKWTHSTGHGSKHFSSLFHKNVHVLGEALHSADPSDWECLNPSEECHTLITGWDIGHTNHAFQILERRINEFGKSVFYVLDELVTVNERVSVEEFGYAAIEKIELVEKFIGKQVAWYHWSDTSAFAFNAHGTDAMDTVTIERISHGRIRFLSARNAKGPGSVRKRIELLQRLLRENRLFVSAHCFATIQMFEQLRKGYKALDVVLRGDGNKHPFDSLSYAIYSEVLEDLEESSHEPATGKRLISIAL